MKEMEQVLGKPKNNFTKDNVQ